MTITEFLEDRIDDDEWQAKASLGERLPQTADEEQWSEAVARRVLAECAAKRAVVTSYRSCQHAEAEAGKSEARDIQVFGVKMVSSGMVKGMEIAIKHLAAVYADHPDYQQEWA